MSGREVVLVLAGAIVGSASTVIWLRGWVGGSIVEPLRRHRGPR